MIKRIQFKKAGTPALENSWLAPYAGEEAFLINGTHLIMDDEVHDFDAKYYSGIFDVLATWD